MEIERSLREVEVLALDLQPPLAMEASTPVADVIREMQQRGLGYTLIMENDQLAGIFTERDILLAVLGDEAVLSQSVSVHMSPDPVCIGVQDPVREAVLRMHAGGYRQIPIVDASGHVAGCVRHKDIAVYLVDHYAEHVLNLPPDPAQIARTPEGG